MKRLLKFLAVTLVIFGLTACDTVDEKMLMNAQETVAQQLKDPDSARFSDVFIVRGERGVTPPEDTWQNVAVCGYVNGKNAFGAYAGSMRFVVLFREYDKSNSHSVIYVKTEETGQKSSKATLDSNNTSKPESVFDKIYWNKDCVDAEHSPIFSGVDW
ncbi:hypothetical protein [Serratia fonticola]|uniref:hypothetical protein n=1 Tax=Serratia fonticola TaxID=47917 RepID=UPI000A6301AE|nr:hypothetical protein [Serratia fonticola]